MRGNVCVGGWAWDGRLGGCAAPSSLARRAPPPPPRHQPLTRRAPLHQNARLSPAKNKTHNKQTCAEAKDAKKIVTLFYLD